MTDFDQIFKQWPILIWWEIKTEYLDDERKYGRDSGGFERFIGSIPTGGPSKHQSSIKPIKEWIIY